MVDVLKIQLDLTKSNNWPGDKLGKQRNKTGELKKIAGRRDHAAITVDNVGDRMKCVKGDSDRQDDIKQGSAEV